MAQDSSKKRTTDSKDDNRPSRIIRFFDPATKAPFDPDEPGTKLDDVVGWGDHDLEYRHDFIQHLFPLPERSGANPDAPLLTETDWRTFGQRTDLQAAARRGYVRMCEFYGLQVESASAGQVQEDSGSIPQTSAHSVSLVKGPNWGSNSRSWLQYSSHHHLRFSRMIRSCRILGLVDEAIAFYTFITHANHRALGVVSRTSVQFWFKAREQPLSWPLDGRSQPVQWLEQSDPAADGTIRRD